MLSKLITFYKTSLNNFSEAVFNLILFLPYFFSVGNLLKTLFYPWKGLVAKKTAAGFSSSEWLERTSFNLISVLMGFILRFSIIVFYFLLQSVFLITIPIILVFYFALIPVLFIESLLTKTEAEKKESSRLRFIGTHLLDQKNYKTVALWFEQYYQDYVYKTKWWKKSNLFSQPPLARDWAVGFTPTLDQYAEELTASGYSQARANMVDREKELKEIERTLSKSQEANVVVVGEEGVGKHTIIDALAKKMYEGKVNPLLMYKRIVKINMEKILSEFTDQKSRENFFEGLLREAAAAKNVIIFIDNIDRYVSSEIGRVDLTASIEKFGKTTLLQIIGITTPFLYQRYINSNEKLQLLLTKIEVREVSVLEALEILMRTSFIFEQRHTVFIPFEAIKEVIEKSDFYVTSIPFPEKAMDLLDMACVMTNELKQPEKIVTPPIINRTLTEKTHVPTVLTADMKEKLLHLEELLKHKIVDQAQAVEKLSSAMRRSFVLMGKRKKPLASFLFLGPTGVGKTETAKSIARIFFGSDAYLIRFDMSNYQSSAEIPHLIGSLESTSPGLLSKAVRETPYGVLLLDEIEKADKNLLNIFLTILDEGYFTDGFGKRADCKNLVIIATSNAGSDVIYKKVHPKSVLDGVNTTNVNLVNYLIEQKIFTPEFLNRFDGVVEFNPLSQLAIRKIVLNIISEVIANIEKLHKVKVTISDNIINSLVAEGAGQDFGARGLDRLIRDQIEDKIAKTIFEGKAKEGGTISL